MKRKFLAVVLFGCLLCSACAGRGVSDTVTESTPGVITAANQPRAENENSGGGKAIAEGNVKEKETVTTGPEKKAAEIDMEHAVSTYYEGQDSRAFKMLQKSIFKNLLDGWTGEEVEHPVWNYDSFARYEILNPDLTGTEEEAELYYCTFSADNGKYGYGIFSYHGDGMSKMKVAETPYLYDLQANREALSDAFQGTELDSATASAMRVEIKGAAGEESREAIRISDEKGHTYFYYFEDGSLKTAEEAGTGMAVLEEKTSGGQEKEQTKQSYYNDFQSKVKEDTYFLKGVVHQNKVKRGLVRVEAPAGTRISIKGSMAEESGEISLVYKDSDGTETVLAKGSAGGNREQKIDATVAVKDGKGDLYFEGDAAVCQFELSLGLSEDIKYYLTGENPIA